MPVLFEVVPHVLPALLEHDHVRDACRIVAALPALIEEAPYGYWNPLLESSALADVRSRCDTESPSEYEPLDLSGLFELVKHVVSDTDTASSD